MNRREFLTVAAAAAAAPLVHRRIASVARAGEPGWQMHLSTSSIQFKDLPIEKVCERIAGLGFAAIDIWSGYENCPHLDDIARRLGAEGLKELLARHSLKLCAFSTYVGGYARYAELLGKAGGGVAIEGSTAPCKPEELRARMKDYLESLKPLVALAEKHDSYLAIENHGHALLDSLDSLKAFVELNPSPRLGIALAPYHLQAIGVLVPEAIQVCDSQLFFFYAWQKAAGIDQLPGHGPADFKPWLEALAGIRYRRYVNPFMHGHPAPDEMTAALAKSAAYLKSLAGRQA